MNHGILKLTQHSVSFVLLPSPSVHVLMLKKFSLIFRPFRLSYPLTTIYIPPLHGELTAVKTEVD